MCESAGSQFNLPTDFAVRFVTTHALLYSSHVEYVNKNDIVSLNINTAAPWSNRDPLEHNLEPVNLGCRLISNNKYY